MVGNTQRKNKVPFKDLPEENKKVMLYVAQQINKWALEKCLEFIGNDLDNYEIVEKKISDIINGILRLSKEKKQRKGLVNKA